MVTRPQRPAQLFDGQFNTERALLKFNAPLAVRHQHMPASSSGYDYMRYA